MIFKFSLKVFCLKKTNIPARGNEERAVQNLISLLGPRTVQLHSSRRQITLLMRSLNQENSLNIHECDRTQKRNKVIYFFYVRSEDDANQDRKVLRRAVARRPRPIDLKRVCCH